MKTQITKLLKATLIIGLAMLALVGSRQTTRAESHAFGSDQLIDSKALLTVFDDLYFRRLFGNVTLPTDQNGNAVVAGTALMPLPNAPGDGTPASINVTLKAGQPFFLPLLALPGTSYTDGTQPDAFVDLKVLRRNLTFKLRIDGRLVLDESNAMDFYSQFQFDPPIGFDSPPIDAVIYLQAISILHQPLSPGTHVIKLDEKLNPVPIFGGVEFHNTFNITVLPNAH